MNIFDLDIDPSFNFFCPITGSRILGDDHFEASPATVFVYCQEASDFDSLSEPYKSIWETIVDLGEDDDSCDDLWQRFCKQLAEEHPNVLIFGFTTHGMACGPVSSTIYIAIDFAYVGDERETVGEDESEFD